MKLARILIASVLSLVLARPATADPLANLRATLGQMHGLQPIRVMLDRQGSSEVNDEGKGVSQQFHAAIPVEDGPDGMRIFYPQALLAQVERESRARKLDPEKSDPTRDAIQSISAMEAHNSLNFAPVLLNDLLRAEVTSSRPGAFQGKKATIVSLKLNPLLAASEKKRVKKNETTMILWIGENGLPLAAERENRVRASVLLISFENIRKESWTFTERGDRLVATRHSEEDSGSGFGQKYQRMSTTTLSFP